MGIVGNPTGNAILASARASSRSGEGQGFPGVHEAKRVGFGWPRASASVRFQVPSAFLIEGLRIWFPVHRDEHMHLMQSSGDGTISFARVVLYLSNQGASANLMAVSPLLPLLRCVARTGSSLEVAQWLRG